MPSLTNTYDEAPSMGLGGTNSWNGALNFLRLTASHSHSQEMLRAAFLHLAAVKAAEELATRAGDAAFAATCTRALARARSTTIDLLWDDAHSRFKGYVCHASGQAPAGAENTDNLMADALYGVLWAKILGLDLGINATLFHLHQRASYATANAYGLPFWVST